MSNVKDRLREIALKIPSNMNYHPGAMQQIAAFNSTAQALGDIARVEVINTHLSKRIELPVMRAGNERGDRSVTWLDNFHELDLHYMGPPIELTMEECGYTPMTADAYRTELERVQGYSWRGWSDDEIADPRIARALVTREDGSTYWNARSFEAKDRWLARYENAEWYSKDWANGVIIGDVPAVLAGEQPCLWQAHSVFNESLGHYGRGSEKFSIMFRTGSIASRIDLIRKMLTT